MCSGQENIDSLLKALQSLEENGDITEKKDLTSESTVNTEESSVIHDFKSQSSEKYNDYGYKIHRSLKESQDNHSAYIPEKKSTWRTYPKNANDSLSVSSSKTSVKLDVYSDPIFGLRIINPIVSLEFIKTKMVGRQAVPICKIKNHLLQGQNTIDWVFAGVIVSKSGVKISKTLFRQPVLSIHGNQYCMWKISDLRGEMKQVSLYLFGKAYKDLWKHSVAAVVGILNATPFPNWDKNSDDVIVTVKNPDQVMLWGTSKDFGVCKAKKKNGDNCTMFINKNECEYCIYHVKREYNKFSGKRAELQTSFSMKSRLSLQNKVLGKNEVFYGGRSFAKTAPIRKSAVVGPSTHKFGNIGSSNIENRPDSNNKSTAPYVDNVYATNSRWQKIQQAAEAAKLKEEAVKKRKTPITFAEIFSKENAPANAIGINRKIENKSIRKFNIDSNLTKSKLGGQEIDLIVEGEPVDFNISTSINVEKIESPFIVKNKSLSSSLTLSKLEIYQLKKQQALATLMNRPTENLTSSIGRKTNTTSSNPDVRKTTISDNDKSKTNYKKDENSKLVECVKENPDYSGSARCEKITDDFNRHSSPNDHTSYRRSRLQLAKERAIQIIRKTGGIPKEDPNSLIQTGNNGKRKSHSLNAETDERESSTQPLSKRFVELMNATSNHSELIDIAEEDERQLYFDKMEKKERLEEKMMTTFKVPCKAVRCVTCKYTWFSASDLCKSDGHCIKVVDAIKRFFKCSDCKNRAVSLDVIPLTPCKQCGGSKWTRAAMMKEKLARTDSLCIRGDEEKFLNSTSVPHLNLLLPVD